MKNIKKFIGLLCLGCLLAHESLAYFTGIHTNEQIVEYYPVDLLDIKQNLNGQSYSFAFTTPHHRYLADERCPGGKDSVTFRSIYYQFIKFPEITNYGLRLENVLLYWGALDQGDDYPVIFGKKEQATYNTYTDFFIRGEIHAPNNNILNDSSLINMPFMKMQVICANNFNYELILTLSNVIDKAKTKTCTYTSNRNQVVNLRETSKNDLDRGEVLGGSFNLNLNCPTNSQIQRAYAVFTDQTTPSNNSNILTLTNNSTAKGVGLKIYPAGDSQAVKFSPVQSNVMDISQANRLKNYHSGGG